MDKINFEQPIFFEKNRVYRNYLGGAGFDNLCHDGSTDGIFPEEWIGSKVRAINPIYFGERDGVSKLEGTNIFFDDFLKEYPEELLGDRKYDCLVKYLDSFIRLPVQTHPTPEFSKKFFNSPYGKTEAWLILATRGDAKIYFGFKDKINIEILTEYADRSLNEKDILSELITGVPARVGDVFLIRAGLIHAIGKGCTILEVQEPTDFTIQIENWCGENRVTETEKYLGLKKEDAMSCFDFNKFGENAVENARCIPITAYDKDGVKCENLITYSDTPCFAENRYTLTGGIVTPTFGPSIWCVVSGHGKIYSKNFERKLNQGDYFFVPYMAENKLKITGDITLVECLPSRQF